MAPVPDGAPYYDTDAKRYLAPFYPRFWPERLEQPLKYFDKGIFCCNMSDLMGNGIPEYWQRQIFNIIERTSRNRYYLLTKQPQNLARFSPYPDNCWVGVTATDARTTWYAMKNLKNIEAKVKYISFEPLLEEIPNTGVWPLLSSLANCGISWIIIGACTKPYRPPRIEWVREIVEAADKAGVSVFLKDNYLLYLEN